MVALGVRSELGVGRASVTLAKACLRSVDHQPNVGHTYVPKVLGTKPAADELLVLPSTASGSARLCGCDRCDDGWAAVLSVRGCCHKVMTTTTQIWLTLVVRGEAFTKWRWGLPPLVSSWPHAQPRPGCGRGHKAAGGSLPKWATGH